MCLLPDLNLFAVATTDHQLIFYDLNAHSYTGSMMINEFPHSLCALDYRLSSNDQSAILSGDIDGNVFIFRRKDPHRPMFHISDSIETTKTKSMRTFSLRRILQGESSTVSVVLFCHLHLDAIVQIKWIEDLEFFVSSALTSRKSLFIGDLQKKIEKYAQARKGFTVFDYCQVEDRRSCSIENIELFFHRDSSIDRHRK